ncbi:MAG: amidase family protein [Halolamina sp.]
MSTPAEFDVREATVAEIHDAIAGGDCTAVDLVESYRARIAAYDDELNAVLTLNGDAHERADHLDERFAEEGFTGSLHGVPLLLKDNQDTADMPTTAGSAALADCIPEEDAFVVEQLREAGAVVLGKANLQELSFGVDTISSLGGATRNAYDRARRPSGSSGGTASAIAANLAAVGTGSDTCSSVRSPPAFNDLVGFRPSRGLVSASGVVPLCATQDTVGPITRTVEDAARMLDVLVGYDREDPVTATGVGEPPADGYVSHLRKDGLSGARIGVARELFGLSPERDADPDAAQAVTEVIDDAIAELEAAGATVVDPVEIIDREFLDSARVLGYEFKRDIDAYLADRPEVPYDTLAELVETDIIAPSIEKRIHDGDILEADTERLRENAEYLDRLERRREIRVDTEARLVEHDLDALLYPPSTVPPVKIPAHQPFEELRCELAAHTGLPAITVPAGFTDDGLPVGLELLGRKFAEPRLLEVAYSFEQATDHRRPPEGFGRID